MVSYLFRLRGALVPARCLQRRRQQPIQRQMPSTSSVGVGIHHQRQQRCTLSVYGFGQQWSGALSRGADNLSLEEAPEMSPEEIQQFAEPQNMIPLHGVGVEDKMCVAASAGWGHTALIVADGTAADSTIADTKLMVCGRPHDFQQLMRLRRLLPFMRNFCVKHTLPAEYRNGNGDREQSSPEDDNPPQPSTPSVMQRVASYLAGENEVTFHEEETRRYCNIPSLLEMGLPNGEKPALEGEELTNSTFESHASGNIAKESGTQSQNAPLHTHFQNTLATSAAVTAIISKTGKLYAFGLNHRGQCGSGAFTPNTWYPTQVAGLASTRFILDHGTGTGDEMFKGFKQQENPIVSVALGLQHGVALDSAGQIFCWGKGERGQLGQGRRLLQEALLDEEGGEYTDNQSVEEEKQQNENRTFDYALHVPNFHDPYATITPGPDDIYAPLLSQDDSKVRLISAGMNFTVAVTNSNLPYIWGKNICLNPMYSESGINIRSKPVQDSTYPRYIPGLPPGLQIDRIACGTHHLAMLLEDGSIWAVGVATDRPVPLWGEAVEILAPGLIDMKELISFTAGFDRTAVVYGLDRRQVIEVQLWSNEELREHGAVRPSWLDWLGEQEKVSSVHRGWMHSIVVTKDK